MELLDGNRTVFESLEDAFPQAGQGSLRTLAGCFGFSGDETAPRDDLAIEIWKKTFRDYGVEAEFSEDVTAVPPTLEESKNWKYHIFPYGKKKNWWQRAEAPGELGGPTSEMFYDLGTPEHIQDSYDINDD